MNSCRLARALTLSWIVLTALLPVAASAAPTTSARLSEVAVTTDPEDTAVRIRTSGKPTYRVTQLDGPPRVIVDFNDTSFEWRRGPLTLAAGPVRQIRGSQFRKDVARVVMELAGPAAHVVREESGELVVGFPGRGAQGSPTAPATTQAAPHEASSAPTPPAQAAGEAPHPAPSMPEPARASAPSVPAVAAVTPAPTPPPAPARSNGPRLISLDFKEAEVVNLLRILAAESGKNIVIGEDVKGRMSIALRNVPWEQALETVLESRGLQRIDRDNVIRIVSDEQLTKERETRARGEEAKMKAEVDIRTKLAEAQVKEVEAQKRKLEAEAAAREADARGPLKEETMRLSYADPEEVARTLQGILGIPPEGRKLNGVGVISGPPPIGEPPFSQIYGVQPPPPSPPPMSISQNVLDKGLTIRAHKPTNTLFLRLYAADLERIKALIRDSLDVPLPQVKIEARMEILDRNALEQIGIQWGGFMAGNVGSNTLVGQGFTSGGPTGTGPAVPLQGVSPANTGLTLQQALPISSLTGLPLGGNIVNLPISSLPNAGPLPAAGLAFGIVGTNFNVNLALQALAELGKTRTLARPEIVTVENSKASIELGEEIPYATISSVGTQIQFKKASLKLDVTPTVIREGGTTKIKMVVVVENNSRGSTVNLGSAGQPPAINTRKAETQVLIKEGDRLIIGGVTTSTDQNTIRKVPVLGDIPLLGNLFKIKENFENGRELVVFLTPSVLRPLVTSSTAPAAPRPSR